MSTTIVPDDDRGRCPGGAFRYDCRRHLFHHVQAYGRSRRIPCAPPGGRRPQVFAPCTACGISDESRRMDSPRDSECAFGDSPRTKLCIRRQPERQTVHLTTRCAINCAFDDNQDPFLAARCRRMHSLTSGLSPDAQFDVLAVVGYTVWRSGCRQMHSLECSLSPDAQFDPRAVVRHAVPCGCRHPTRGTRFPLAFR